MKKIILITSYFPYLPGEQFLETEIKYYQNFEEIKLTLLPISSSDKKRTICENIILDNTLNKNINKTKSEKIKFLFKAMSKSIFYKELLSINIFNFNILKSFLGAMSSYEKYYCFFNKYLAKEKNLEDTIIYTYWNTECTYALQSLKKTYNFKLISRIHRFDIYKEERINSYMPLKKHFTNNIDKLYTITDSATHYLHNIYQFNYENLSLGRLGVDDLNIITKTSEKSSLNIVSCSFLSEIKRIDKIIDALSIVLDKNKDINYTWTHIGGGTLFDKISKYAEEKLHIYNNLVYKFEGNINNQEIYKLYQNNAIDIFINTSESEGVPVSIMEAMSCHIPIIAPKVGGIEDMVINEFNGILLSNEAKVTEIINALEKIDLFKNQTIRSNSYKIFSEKYNAEKNYKLFINQIIDL